MKHIHLIYTLLFGVAVLLFFGLAYPHHLHYQEQFQLFLFDSNYVWEIVRLPGGVADLLGRFCTQYFLFAWVGAAIIAVLLSLVQLLTLRLLSLSRNWVGAALYGLSFVPSFLLWIFLLDENALLGGVWAVFLTLLASWLFDKLPKGWVRRIVMIVAIPVLYWMVGPVCVLFFLLQALHFRQHSLEVSPTTGAAWHLGMFMLLAIMLVILSSYIPVPASKLWTGVHYHRYPTEIPVLLWAAVLSIFVLTLMARLFQREKREVKNKKDATIPASYPSGWRQLIIYFSLFAFTFVVMGTLVWKNSNFKAEKVMQYDFMACHQQWNRILQTVSAEKPNNQIGVTAQNLALAMHGMLSDHLFEYHQNGIAGLLPDVERDATSPMPTAEAFYQLGMISVAQRTVFEAQEAILDFQKSGRCYKRLAQTNLILGNYEVARKYLTALQKTLFYRNWANETLPLLGNEEAIARHPEYGRLRQCAYDQDFYFSDHVTPDMLESLFFGRPTSVPGKNTENRLAFEYLKAYYMLTGDREGYANLLLHTSNKQ